MPQRSLFPLRIVNFLPGRPGGADNAGVAVLDNGKPHLIKRNTPQNPLACANEWLGLHLAHACGVPAPTPHLVRENGGMAIGIPIYDDVGKAVTTKDAQWLTEFLRIVATSPQASRIHALDATINNVDRHLNNFLIRNVSGEPEVLAIDFGRALFFRDLFPPSAPGTVRDSATGQAWNLLRGHADHWPNVEHVDAMLDSLAALPDDWIDRRVREMPAEWLPKEYAKRMASWFKQDRISDTDKVRRFMHAL